MKELIIKKYKKLDEKISKFHEAYEALRKAYQSTEAECMEIMKDYEMPLLLNFPMLDKQLYKYGFMLKPNGNNALGLKCFEEANNE